MANKGQVDITLQINAEAKEAQSQIQRLAEYLKNIKLPSSIGTSVTKEIQKAKDALSEYFALYSKENRTLKDENRMAAALNKADEAGRRLAQHFEELGRVDLKNLLPTDVLDRFKNAQEVVDKLGKEYEKTIKNQNSAKEKQKGLQEDLVELERSRDQLVARRKQSVDSKFTEDQIKAEQAELKKRQDAYAKKLAVNNREAQTDEAVELAKNRSIVSAFTSQRRTVKRAEEQEQLKTLQKEQTELQKSAKAADDAVKAYEQGDNALAKVTTSIGQYLDKVKDYYEQYKKLAGNSALSFDEWRKSDKKTAIKAREIKPDKVSGTEEEFKVAQAEYQKLLNEREKANQALAENESKISALNGPLQAEQQAYNAASESVKKFEEGLSESKDAVTEQEKHIKSLTDANKEADNSIKKIDSDLEKNTKSIEDNKAETARLLAEQSKLSTEAQGTFNKIKVAVEAALGRELPEGVQNVEQLKEHLSNLKAEEISKVKQALEQMGSATEKASNAASKGSQTQNEYNQALNRTEQEAKESQREIDNLSNRFKQLFTLTSGIQIFRRAIRDAFNTIKELDAVMTQTAVVSEYSVSDMWSMLPQYTKNAQALGVAISDVYSAQTLYIQQGLDFKNSMDLGIESLKMARIANIDAASATQAMTAALRGFNMELDKTSAQRINDVYSELAKITAADTQQISTAMTKTASIAHSANMEFEKTAALLSQIIETTQEAPETAGTAMKTIIGRFTEIKKLYSKGELEGTDDEGETIKVNRVSTALSAAGINLNEFFTGAKGLDDIFLELSKKWDTLDIVTQRYIATMAAGSRQQSRFIAMMQDYARTIDLVNAAENSEGSAQKQFEKTLESMDAKVKALKDTWQQFTMGILNSNLAKSAVDFAKNILNLINKITSSSNDLLGSIKKIGAGLAVFGMGKKIVNGKFGFGMLQRLFLGSGKGEKAVKPIITEFFGNLQKVATNEATKGKIFSFGDLANAWINTKGHQSTGLMALFNTFSLKNIRNNNLFDAFSQFEDELGGGESWDKLVKALKKTGLSMDEAQNKADSLQEALINLKTTAKSTETFKESAKTVKEFNESLTYTPTILSKIKAGFNGLKASIGGLISTLISLLPYILAIAAAWATWKVIQDYLYRNSYEGKLEAINKSTKALKDQTQQLNDEYKKLNSTLDELSENDKALNKLISGTDSWKKKVDESNKAILELIDQYQDLAKYVNSETISGKIVLSIDEDQAKKVIEQQQIQVQIEQDTDQIQQAQLELENLYDNLSSKIKRPFEDKTALDDFVKTLFSNVQANVALSRGEYSQALEIAGLEDQNIQIDWLSENYKSLQDYYSKSTGYEAEIAGYTSSILDNTFKMAYGDNLTEGQKAARNSVSTKDWNDALAGVDKEARTYAIGLLNPAFGNKSGNFRFYQENQFDLIQKYLESKGLTGIKRADQVRTFGYDENGNPVNYTSYGLKDKEGKDITYKALEDLGYEVEDFITFVKNELASKVILEQSTGLQEIFNNVPKDSLLHTALFGNIEELSYDELNQAWQLLEDFYVKNAEVFKESGLGALEFYDSYEKAIVNLKNDTKTNATLLSQILGESVNELSSNAVNGLLLNIQKVIISQGEKGETAVKTAFESLFNSEFIKNLSEKDKKVFFNLLSSIEWSTDNLKNLSVELKKLGIAIPEDELKTFIESMSSVSKVSSKPLDTKEIEKYQTALLKLSKAIRESAPDDSSWRQMSEDAYKALTYQGSDLEDQFVYNAENDTWDYIGDNTSEILNQVSNIYGVISGKEQLQNDVNRAETFDKVLQYYQEHKLGSYTDIMQSDNEQDRTNLFNSILNRGQVEGLFSLKDLEFYQQQADLYGDSFISSFIESFYNASLKKAENLERLDAIEDKEEMALLQTGTARSRTDETGQMRLSGRTRRVDETGDGKAHKRKDTTSAIATDLLNRGFGEDVFNQAITEMTDAASDEEWAKVADKFELMLDYSDQIKRNALFTQDAWKDGAEYLMRTGQAKDWADAYAKAYEQLMNETVSKAIVPNAEKWADVLRKNINDEGLIDWEHPNDELKEFINEIGDLYKKITGNEMTENFLKGLDSDAIKILEQIANGDFSKLKDFNLKFGVELKEEDVKKRYASSDYRDFAEELIDLKTAASEALEKGITTFVPMVSQNLKDALVSLGADENQFEQIGDKFMFTGEQDAQTIISLISQILGLMSMNETDQAVVRQKELEGMTNEQLQNQVDNEGKILEDAYQTLFQRFLQSGIDQQNINAIANREGVYQNYTQDQLADEMNSMMSNQQQISDLGLNPDTIRLETEELLKLNEAMGMDRETAQALAIAHQALDTYGSQAVQNWKEWQKVLNNPKSTTTEINNTYAEMTETLQKMFGGMKNLSANFLKNEKNMKLFEKAVKGDEKALQQLRREAAKDSLKNVLQSMGKSEKEAAALATQFDELASQLDQLTDFDDGRIDWNDSLAVDEFLKSCNELVNAAGMTAQQAKAYFQDLGFDADVETEMTKQPYKVHLPAGEYGPEGAKVTWNEMDIEGWTETPAVAIKSITKDGSSGGKITKGGKGGGGGGGGGGEKKEPWKNSFDRFHNLKEAASRTDRERNKLEREYNNLLKEQANILNKNDFHKNLLDQVEALKQQVKYSKDLVEYYDELAKGKNWEAVEWMKQNADLKQFLEFDDETDEILIDWDRINQITDQDEGSHLEEVYQKLEEFRNAIWEAEDNRDEAIDKQNELIETLTDTYRDLREAFLTMEERIRDAIYDARQKEIDELDAIYEAQDNNNSKILDGINEIIDEQRKAREQQKQRDELEEKQRRLTLLKQDTSGANSLEILALEKELAESQENYIDSLVDNALEEISKGNEKAQEQRDMQIELLQWMLDYDKEHGAFWDEVTTLMNDAYDEDGQLKRDSALVKLLQSTEEFEALSAFGQDKWWDDLRAEMVKAQEGSNIAKILLATEKIEADLAREHLQTGNNQEFRRDKGTNTGSATGGGSGGGSSGSSGSGGDGGKKSGGGETYSDEVTISKYGKEFTGKGTSKKSKADATEKARIEAEKKAQDYYNEHYIVRNLDGLNANDTMSNEDWERTLTEAERQAREDERQASLDTAVRGGEWTSDLTPEELIAKVQAEQGRGTTASRTAGSAGWHEKAQKAARQAKAEEYKNHYGPGNGNLVAALEDAKEAVAEEAAQAAAAAAARQAKAEEYKNHYGPNNGNLVAALKDAEEQLIAESHIEDTAGRTAGSAGWYENAQKARSTEAATEAATEAVTEAVIETSGTLADYSLLDKYVLEGKTYEELLQMGYDQAELDTLVSGGALKKPKSGGKKVSSSEDYDEQYEEDSSPTQEYKVPQMYASFADEDTNIFKDPNYLNKLLGSNYTVGQNNSGYYISDSNGNIVNGLSLNQAIERVLDIANIDSDEEQANRGTAKSASDEVLSLANRLRIDTKKNGGLNPEDFINKANGAFSTLQGASVSYDQQNGVYVITDNATGEHIDSEFQSDVIETLEQWQQQQQQKEDDTNTLLSALSEETGLSRKQISDLINEKGTTGIEQLDALYQLDLDLSDEEKDLMVNQIRQDKEIGSKNEQSLGIINSSIGDAGQKLDALGAIMERVNQATGGRNASYTDSTGKKWTWTATGADAGVNYENWLLGKINAVEAQIKKDRAAINTPINDSSTPSSKKRSKDLKDDIDKLKEDRSKSISPEEKNKINNEIKSKEDELKKIKKFDTGGYTGDWHSGEGRLAMLHQKELVLNATDTANFIQLRDILRDMDIGNPNTGITNYEIHIEVDEISDDYSVEQLADKVKDLIVEESNYRNVNQINTTR